MRVDRGQSIPFAFFYGQSIGLVSAASLFLLAQNFAANLYVVLVAANDMFYCSGRMLLMLLLHFLMLHTSLHQILLTSFVFVSKKTDANPESLLTTYHASFPSQAHVEPKVVS